MNKIRAAWERKNSERGEKAMIEINKMALAKQQQEQDPHRKKH